MNEIVLKGLWRSEDKPTVNGEKSVEKKKSAPKEIKVIPLIVRRLECLRTSVDYPSPLLFRTWPCNKNFVGINETLIDVININSDPSGRVHEHRQWIRAGPRKAIKFDVKKVCAAIVTCGGLCPGLNNVIREITTTLIRTYNVENVYGIQYGYKGFYAHQWRKLDLAVVRDIHKTGGTILGTSRGGFDLNRFTI